MSPSLSAACGQLLVGGFAGAEMPASFARALKDGSLGGAILFRRNLTDDLAQIASLTSAIRDAVPRDLPPPIVAIDQEGGRVTRLPSPALKVPPMRALGRHGDVTLVERIAGAQARELAVLGFNLNFSPILDVDTNPANPVIGDRAFSDDAATVARFGVAYIRALQAAGVLACGKHFPGHGDTAQDSHFALPSIDHPRARLDAVELLPFRAAARAFVASMMTAHVVCRALDATCPATLSRAICTTLLRDTIAFEGVLVSDDLEMKAVSDRYGVEAAATAAVEAGCDVLLVCSDESLQARAHGALVARAERDAAFRERCLEASRRVLAMRRSARSPYASTTKEEIAAVVGGAASQKVAREIAEVVG